MNKRRLSKPCPCPCPQEGKQRSFPKETNAGEHYYCLGMVHEAGYLTFSGQDRDADTRVTELDKRQAACLSIFLSDQQNIFGADISMNEVLVLLCADYDRDFKCICCFSLHLIFRLTESILECFEIKHFCMVQQSYQVVHSPGQLLGHF